MNIQHSITVPSLLVAVLAATSTAIGGDFVAATGIIEAALNSATAFTSRGR